VSGGIFIDGTAGMLLVADHASDAVPPGVDLGVDPAVMATHIAVDLGVAALTRALSAALAAPALLGDVSRLVVDLNREPDSAGLIPRASDGIAVSGNSVLSDDDRRHRLDTWHAAYHARLSGLIDARAPRLLVSIHSFTPELAAGGSPRPWPVGILYNRDDRAARRGLRLFRERGIDAGDNQPYSGRDLNYTMNRHAEARGLPYLGVEVRQDGLADLEGIATWSATLAAIIGGVFREMEA
jgi:predicted N-formylglutamate amidohydrolase